MKDSMIVVVSAAFALIHLAMAKPANYANWIGVWQGELDGVPGVTVTLGGDAGDLEGTIVFNVVDRQGSPHVIGHDAHVMTHLRVDRSTLTFQVIRLGDSRDLHLTMRLTENGKAQLQCGDCGGPPSPELTRLH